MNDNVKIRPIKETDKDFIVDLSLRFNEFEMMEWRDSHAMEKAQLKMAKESVNNKEAESDIFVAEDNSGQLLGFLHIKKNIDHFTKEEQGYISSIAVSDKAEGKGIAKKFMKTAEEWAKYKGYKQLILDVFSSNERAVNFYRHMNFETEVVKMVKELE